MQNITGRNRTKYCDRTCGACHKGIIKGTEIYYYAIFQDRIIDYLVCSDKCANGMNKAIKELKNDKIRK